MISSEGTLQAAASELAGYIDLRVSSDGLHDEEAFFYEVYESLDLRGFCSEGVYGPYRAIRKGIRADGFAWIELEKTLCLFVIEFKNTPDNPQTISQTELNRDVERGIKFLTNVLDGGVVGDLPPGHESLRTAEGVIEHFPNSERIKIIYLTDGVLSERVKNFEHGDLYGRKISVEPWDLPRISELFKNPEEAEPILVGKDILGNEGILALSISNSSPGIKSYLCVMPGIVLSKLYATYGQRLLEANVRSFLNFNSNVNKGIRTTLLKEPERVFNYNNGITATADGIETSTEGSAEKIVGLKNLQIVNGGQTTAAIFFSSKDPGGIDTPQGRLLFRDIDLSKVYVQMKLSVFDGLDEGTKDELRGNISRYANFQNGVQSSDFVSNHPIQKALEQSSRVTSFRGESGLEKWYFERVKGQYETTKRALRIKSEIRKFELEFPRSNKFTKTDLIKYDYTWALRPHDAKKGAQKVFKAYIEEQTQEYDKKGAQSFGVEYFKEEVAKAILFKTVDKMIGLSDWYKEERGLKAEMTAYSIALFRYHLLESGFDIDLKGIAQRQKLNSEIAERIVSAAKIIRKQLQNKSFTGGMANISEFCKHERAWEKVKTITIDVSGLPSHAVLSLEDIRHLDREEQNINKVDMEINLESDIVKKGRWYYQALKEFNDFHETHPMATGLPKAAINFLDGGRPLTSKQIKALLKVERTAQNKGFEYSSS